MRWLKSIHSRWGLLIQVLLDADRVAPSVMPSARLMRATCVSDHDPLAMSKAGAQDHVGRLRRRRAGDERSRSPHLPRTFPPVVGSTDVLGLVAEKPGALDRGSSSGSGVAKSAAVGYCETGLWMDDVLHVVHCRRKNRGNQQCSGVWKFKAHWRLDRPLQPFQTGRMALVLR